MTKVRKRVPRFENEQDEREFWSRADSTEHVDWERAQRMVLPDLRPSLKTISLRLPAPMLADLKRLANQRDVPYQSLLKVFLAERLREELDAHATLASRDQASRPRSTRRDRRR